MWLLSATYSVFPHKNIAEPYKDANTGEHMKNINWKGSFTKSHLNQTILTI